jgi:hypothetical protein
MWNLSYRRNARCLPDNAVWWEIRIRPEFVDETTAALPEE